MSSGKCGRARNIRLIKPIPPPIQEMKKKICIILSMRVFVEFSFFIKKVHEKIKYKSINNFLNRMFIQAVKINRL